MWISSGWKGWKRSSLYSNCCGSPALPLWHHRLLYAEGEAVCQVQQKFLLIIKLKLKMRIGSEHVVVVCAVKRALSGVTLLKRLKERMILGWHKCRGWVREWFSSEWSSQEWGSTEDLGGCSWYHKISIYLDMIYIDISRYRYMMIWYIIWYDTSWSKISWKSDQKPSDKQSWY